MASTLTITHSGSATLNGVNFTTTVTREVQVTKGWQSSISIPTGSSRNVTPLTNSPLRGYQNGELVMITNTDDTNFLHLTINDSASSTDGFIHMKILPETTFLLQKSQVFTDKSLPATTYTDIESITLEADTAAVVAKVAVFSLA